MHWRRAALHFFWRRTWAVAIFAAWQASVQFDLPRGAGFFFRARQRHRPARQPGAGAGSIAARANQLPRSSPAAKETPLARLATPWPALACLLLGALLTRLPAAVRLAHLRLYRGGATADRRHHADGRGRAALVFSALQRFSPGFQPERPPRPHRDPGAGAPWPMCRGKRRFALGGVLSSFSLIVAMAIMVASFPHIGG